MSEPVAAAADREKIERALDALIKKEACVFEFDRTLVEQLPDILIEQYGISSVAEARKLPAAAALLDAIGFDDATPLSELPARLVCAGVAPDHLATRVAEDIGERFDSFTHQVEKDGVEDILELQRDLGQGRVSKSDTAYNAHLLSDKHLWKYLRKVTTPPPSLIERATGKHFWHLQIAKWMRRGWVSPTEPTLSIGCRWLTEILYFRKIVGLQRHIGLDLHSGDTDLVKVGDMHAAPFEDDAFGLVFTKNTLEKSYNVRAMLAEIRRILRPGGVLIVDTITGYGLADSLGRTEIQSTGNLITVARRYGAREVLHANDIDISGMGDAADKQERRINARLALRFE